MKTKPISRMRGVVLGVAATLAFVVGMPLIMQVQGAVSQTPAVDDQVLVRGEAIFNNVCIACHQPDGKGIEGVYLPLAGNPAVTLEDPTYFVTVILNGRGGMPRFDTTYTDEEIAAIATFIRQNWENDAPAVPVELVTEVRASFDVEDAPTPEGQVPSGASRPEDGEATPDATPGN